MNAQAVYTRLLARYGPQAWWPAKHPFEMMVGAVLVQNTAWRNAARAIDRLRSADCLTPPAMAALGVADLQSLIRPSGTFRVKARRLHHLAAALNQVGGCQALQAMPTTAARRFLLGINGIGEETADAILVYALDRPAFVVDAYARRLLRRFSGRPASDEELRRRMQRAFPTCGDLGELHALIVVHGKQHCRRRPLCEHCPLTSDCASSRVTAGSRGSGQ